MTDLFKSYWNKIARYPLYWVPLLVLSIVGYGFSIFNRTIHWDDLLKDYYYDACLSSRWGMVLWQEIVGVTDLVPFVDRFVALLFMIIASFLFGALLFYLRNGEGKILSYTVLSSMVLTYPLINEIYEYTSANIQYAGNLALMILTYIYLTLNRGSYNINTFVIASLFMILPASSYEVGLFSYITLISLVIFYRSCMYSDSHITIKQWISEYAYFMLPVIIAVIFRYLIAFLLRLVFHLPYIQVGGADIDYSNTSITYLIGSNFFRYFVAGLVYFPITIFVFFSIVFVVYVIQKSLSKHNFQISLLGLIFFFSLFALPILQGICMQYRTAQSLTLYIAFVAFVLCEIKVCTRLLIPCLLLFLCWHQAVYLSNTLSLNNMRSNNEIVSLQCLGNRIISEFDNKPVVIIVSEDQYIQYLGPWIDRRVYANSDSWNGQLFNYLCKSYLPQRYHHYKYINSNIKNATQMGVTLKKHFAYCGYDINVKSISSLLKSIHDSDRKLRLKQLFEDAKNDMHFMEIKDVGECLIVKLCQ